MYIRETKISRHNVTGESACGDVDDENVVVYNLESFAESELNNMLPSAMITMRRSRYHTV